MITRERVCNKDNTDEMLQCISFSSVAEINTIRRVLGGGGASFRVAGKTYTIDRNEFSDLHVHATNEAGDHVWAAVEGSYVIIGVAGPDKSKACEDVVFKFMQELDQCAKRKDEDTV